MKPEAVIIGGGLWYLRDHLRDFGGYRTALQELLYRSMSIFMKVTLDRVDSDPGSEQTDLRIVGIWKFWKVGSLYFGFLDLCIFDFLIC